MSSWLGILRIQKSEILYWLGDGAVAAAGMIWTVVTFIVVHKDAQDRRQHVVNPFIRRPFLSSRGKDVSSYLTARPSRRLHIFRDDLSGLLKMRE